MGILFSERPACYFEVPLSLADCEGSALSLASPMSCEEFMHAAQSLRTNNFSNTRWISTTFLHAIEGTASVMSGALVERWVSFC